MMEPVQSLTVIAFFGLNAESFQGLEIRLAGPPFDETNQGIGVTYIRASRAGTRKGKDNEEQSRQLM
jgi:hypothetical protein